MARTTTLRVDIIGNARRLRSELADGEGALGRFGGAASKAGKVAAAGLAGIGLAAGAAAAEVVKAASNQEQAFGALESVYGANAETVKKWARGAAESVGLSTTAYSELSAVVGSQLQNMGRSSADAAKESDKLIKIGADLSATFGGDVSEAVSAVGSLLRGEADPIERYGVSIKAADVEARLAAQGLDGLTGKARVQAEATAKLELLMQQTKNATGAFGRESGTLAGQQQRLTAQIDNAKAALGERLLPIAAGAATFLVEKFLPAAQAFGGELVDRFGPAVQAVGAFIRDDLLPAGQKLWAQFVETGLPALRTVGTFITQTILPVFRNIAGFVVDRLVPAFVAFLKPALAGIRDLFGSVQGAIDRNRPTLERIGELVKKVAGFMADKLAPILGTLTGTSFRVLGDVLGTIIDTISTLFEWVEKVIGVFGRLLDKIDAITGPLQAVGGAIGGAIGKIPGLGGPPLASGETALTSGVPALVGGHQLATAAGSLDQGLTYLASIGGAGGGAGAGLYVDRRVYNSVTIEGALDAPAVARQLEGILADQARRLGR